MTQNDNFPLQPFHPATLVRRMLAGAAIGLMAITFFLLSLRAPDPSWGRLWMMKPLIIVPLAGAVGGLCNYMIMRFRYMAGANKAVAFLLSAVIFVIGLWLGVVLGLNGTMWN